MKIVVEFRPTPLYRELVEEKRKELIEAIEKAIKGVGFELSSFSVYLTWED